MSANPNIHDTSIVAEGLAQLGEKRKGLPNIEALLTCYLNRLQEIEDVLWDVINSRYLPNAVNAQLDMLGDLVNEQRLGRSDNDYRLAIQVQIRVLRTHGRDFDIIAVALLMGYDFSYLEQWPAGFEIDQFGITTFAYWAKQKFLKTKAAGTLLNYVFTPASKANSFIFGSVYGGVSVGKGFSSTYDATVGGLLGATI